MILLRSSRERDEALIAAEVLIPCRNNINFLEGTETCAVAQPLLSRSSTVEGRLNYDTSVAAATRGLLATDHVILNHGQVTWTTTELAPPLLTTSPTGGRFSSLDRFNVLRCPTRQVFSGTGLGLVTKPAKIRYLDHSATAASKRY
ncbi:uncharacterized protein TNCV_2097491 [Trichonephila clavipes]|nr:uncharacterized protein TNCV_2097491 [Trichonephila clavipes]